jgi:PilZ domain
MSHKRIHIRVPILGEATLVNPEVTIMARAIDISAGGLRIADFPTTPCDAEYLVTLTTFGRGTIEFTARLAHTDGQVAGLAIKSITPGALRTIYHLIADFQASEEFIHYIDQGDILQDWLVDEHGNHLDVTFETGHAPSP